MELISKEELRDKMYHEAFEVDSEMQKWDSGCWIRYKLFEKILDEMPTIESRPTGVWVGIDEFPHEEWECSNCRNIINTYLQDELEEHKYCHKCGAEMSTPWAEMGEEE